VGKAKGRNVLESVKANRGETGDIKLPWSVLTEEVWKKSATGTKGRGKALFIGRYHRGVRTNALAKREVAN